MSVGPRGISLRRIVELLDSGGPFVEGTVVASGEGALLPVGYRVAWRAGHPIEGGSGDFAIDRAIERAATEALASEVPSESSFDREGLPVPLRRRNHGVDVAPGVVEVAWLPHVPEERLAIFGAGHVAIPLCALASTVGYAVTVVDDRARFATAERFPGAREIIVRDFVEAIACVGMTPWTNVVLVTRGHEHDETCLAQVAASPARYVGMIGSRRRVKVVYDRLRLAGVSADALDRVHAPIGLDLGGRSPAEIALAILAEMVLVRRGGTGLRLSNARHWGA
jgi:xanthine/CO dehydrogenase XdhC/CoxF family maturation factor